MATTRAANALMYAGVEDVRLLDGGFDAWLMAGYTVETGVRQPIPAEDFGRVIPGRPEYIIDIDTTKALLADEQGVLVCVRSWDEYIGKTSGYDYIQAKGHIPVLSGGIPGQTLIIWKITGIPTARCVPIMKSKPIGRSQVSPLTKKSPSTVGQAGGQAKRFSMPT